MTRIPILMYHSVNERPLRTTASLAVSPGAFADQMAVLRDRGYTPITVTELTAGGWENTTGRPVVITFDDGYADLHERALPILDGLGFAATAFVTTGWLADAGKEAAGRPLDRMLSWSQAREAAAHGIEIGAHSHRHPQLDQLGDRALRDELSRSKALLEDRLGAPVTAMAYPYGYSSARVRDAVRQAGYRTACAVANQMASDRPDPLALPRLTIRATTSLEAFGRIVDGDGSFLMDRALTTGYAVVRRSRYVARRVLRHG
jgi:peptidoglycan/xylan/chitin deacetylase (PgdA/CDA1 family)